MTWPRVTPTRIILVVLALLGFFTLISFTESCGGKIPPVPVVPVVVEQVDQDVLAGGAKALGILTSGAAFMNKVSKIETEAAMTGVAPAAFDSRFDRLMVAYADASDAAVRKILAGVKSWAELKAVIDPVVAQINAIVELVNSLSAMKAKLVDWLGALVDGVSEPLGEALFGGHR